jgi:hypothetical protein
MGLDIIQTRVVETVYAGLTETVLAQPTATGLAPSATPLLNTMTTNTAIITLTNTPVYVTPQTAKWEPSITPANTATPENKEWRCAILSQLVADSAVMFPNQKFEAGWTIENKGTAYWNSAGVDIIYLSGTEMQDGARYNDLPQDVPPTGNFSFSISMEAPESAGTYQTTWILSGDRGTFCPLTVRIKVE